MTTTTIDPHPRGSKYRDGKSAVTVDTTNVRHICWIYRCMRKDGLKPTDARMALCHAVSAGQRDARYRVNQALAGI